VLISPLRCSFFGPSTVCVDQLFATLICSSMLRFYTSWMYDRHSTTALLQKSSLMDFNEHPVSQTRLRKLLLPSICLQMRTAISHTQHLRSVVHSQCWHNCCAELHQATTVDGRNALTHRCQWANGQLPTPRHDLQPATGRPTLHGTTSQSPGSHL
jgi:hypothetical protein